MPEDSVGEEWKRGVPNPHSQPSHCCSSVGGMVSAYQSQPAAGGLSADGSGASKGFSSSKQKQASHSPPKVSNVGFLKLYEFKKQHQKKPTNNNKHKNKTKNTSLLAFFCTFVGKYIGCFLMFYFQTTTFFILMEKR